MLDKLTAWADPIINRTFRLSVPPLLATPNVVVAYKHLALFGAFTLMGAVLVWPIFGSDYPPGVDTATFLHLSWVTKLAASGQLADPFQDPYWYGGFSYLVAYPPLGYGLVGILSFVTRLDLITEYTVVLVLSFGGLSTATFWLSVEMGLHKWTAAFTGVMVALSYPVLSSIFLWGWFTSVMALPFGLVSILLLERSLRRGAWRPAAWGGVLMAVCILIHHMTGLSLGLGLVGWFLYITATRMYPWQRVARHSAIFVGVTAASVAPWGIPFMIHALDVGFRREFPGLWTPNLTIYRTYIVDSSLIGEFMYPSYLGITMLVLSTGGVVYALVERKRLAGMAVLLLVLGWFSMGASYNPLIKVYPFSGLDVARFHLFMVPFMAILGGLLFERVFGLLREQWPNLSRWLSPKYSQPLWYATVVGLLALILVFPSIEAGKAREFMGAYEVEEPVSEAIDWLARQPSAGDRSADGPIYTVGLWNWDAFIIPYLADRPLIDGWHDEGAHDVEKIRELRIMGWTGQVDIRRAHQLLSELGAGVVLVNRESYYQAESANVFWNEIEAHPEWFEKQDQWDDVAVYRVLP